LGITGLRFIFSLRVALARQIERRDGRIFALTATRPCAGQLVLGLRFNLRHGSGNLLAPRRVHSSRPGPLFGRGVL